MRLLIEEFGITIKYIKGINNTVADALSRLEFTPKKSDTSETIDFLFSLITAEDTDLFPLSMAEIADQQAIDDQLIKRMSQKSQRKYTKRPANDNKVILENDKVFIPQNLHLCIIEWYHH